MKSERIKQQTDRPKRKRLTAEERRTQLLIKAVELFSRRGFEGTTTKAIAAAAGVSEGIIFQHFATKDELYAGILDYKAKETGMDEWEKELRKHAESEDDEALVRSIVERILQTNREDQQFLRLMFQAALKNHPMSKIMAQRVIPNHYYLRDYMIKRQKKGIFRKCDPNVAVHAIFSMPSHYGFAKQLLGIDTIHLPEHQLAENFTQLILGGLRAPDKAPKKTGSKRKVSHETK